MFGMNPSSLDLNSAVPSGGALVAGSFRNRLLVLIAVSVLLRIGVSFYWQSKMDAGESFRFGDSAGYWNLAERVADGRPYQYNSEHAKVFRTPAYPVFLSSLFRVWEQPTVLSARVFGSLLGGLTVYLIFLLGSRVFNEKTGWLSAILIAFYPGAIAVSVLVLAESLFVPLMLTQLLLMVMAWQSQRSSTFFLLAGLAGILYGLACLTRPSWLLFVPFSLPICLLIIEKKKKQLFMAGILCVSLIGIMAPWWIRNYQVTGHFVMTSLQTGTSLYDGWNPEANGASDMEFAPRMKKLFKEQWLAAGNPERELEYAFNEYMKNEALNWAKQHPGQVALLALEKLRRTWTPLPNTTEIGNTTLRWGIAVYYLPLMLFSLAGILCLRQNRLAVWIFVLPSMYYALLHMVFVGSIRYRQPVMILLAVMGASFLATLLENRKAALPVSDGKCSQGNQ